MLLGGLAVVIPVSAAAVGWQWLRARPLALARRAFHQGDYRLAAQLAEEYLMSGHPGDQRAMLLAARSYAHLGMWQQAEAYYGQVPLQAPEDFRQRARGLEIRRLWSEAAGVYEQMLRRWPMDGDALQHLAAIRVQQNRAHEAATLARRLAQIPSHRVTGLIMAGMIQSQLGNPKEAVKCFEQALKLSPELEGDPNGPGVVFQLLAENLLKLGRAAEAETYAQRARELTADAEPCWLLGRARQMAGDMKGAEQYWKEAVARSPRFVDALMDLAQLYLRQGQPDKALPWAEQALKAAPNDESVQYLLRTISRLMAQRSSAPK